MMQRGYEVMEAQGTEFKSSATQKKHHHQVKDCTSYFTSGFV